MPMIEAKVTEFGKAISIMGKPESYLMINLVDGQDLRDSAEGTGHSRKRGLCFLLGHGQLGLEQRELLNAKRNNRPPNRKPPHY